LLAHGRWSPPGTPASSTTKTGRHDIAEIFLKVPLKHNKSNQIKCMKFGGNLIPNIYMKTYVFFKFQSEAVMAVILW
jgi:hypothetical protein